MKAVKFQILKPIDPDVEWKAFAAELRSIQYESAKALNHCMTEWYFWQREKEAWKTENGKYPTFKELPSPEKRLYAEIRGMFPDIQTKTVSEIVRKTKQRWASDAKDCFYRQNKSLPSFRKGHPVLLSGQQYALEKADGAFVVKAGLRPKDFDGRKRYAFQLATKKVTGSQRAIIDRLFLGEYKKSALQITFNDRKRKWFAVFTYEPEKIDNGLDPEKIVGVDLGVVFTFYAAVLGSKDRAFASGKEVSDFRRRIKKRRREIQRAGKFSGRGGRGRAVMLEPVLKIGEKERRFRDTKYHGYTKAIVDFAVKHGAGVIQLENLDGLKAAKIGNFVLNDWAIADLHAKLEYKAEAEGVKVRYVDPRYTSQRCSECGHIDRENRPDQETFRCVSCGFEENADRNAALNLATKGIEDAISRAVADRENDGHPSQLDLAL